MSWVVLAAALLVAVAAPAEEKLDSIELIPEDRAGIGPGHFFAPITSLFRGGPGYWYSPRRIRVNTTPPGAVLDLFYVRRSFQKAYEQADAPIEVVLPSPNEASSYDTLRIRAFMDGYQQTEVTLRVRSREREVMIELTPLSNSLVGVTHLYFADRSAFTFLSKEAVTFRATRSEADYSIVLVETGNTPEATASLRGVQDALVAEVRSQQLGTDLVVKFELSERARAGGVDLRQRQSYDAIRRLHALRLEVVPEAVETSSVERARAALARIGPGHVGACAMRYDGVLHGDLDQAALARALTPQGDFTDPYLRAAMKRLGEISPSGSVVLADGTAYRTQFPLELAAAVSQAGEVRGYLAMLRSFVAELEPAAHRRETLRGLIAPEVAPEDFAAIVQAAEASERHCLAGAH